MTEPFPHLFAPIRLGRTQAKNRIMRVATTANLADRNRATPLQLARSRGFNAMVEILEKAGAK